MKVHHIFHLIIFKLSLLVSSISWAAEPDRDFEVFMRGGDSGLGASLFFTDQLGLEMGYSMNIMSDKTFELEGFTPFASGSYGIRAGFNLALFWEDTAVRGLLLEQDEVSWRIAVRWRPQKLYQIEAKILDFWDALAAIDVQHGTVQSFPITGGLAYTWWALPWGKSDKWWSKLLDFGLVFRVEMGPDFASYDLEKAPFLADGTEIETVQEQRVEDSKVHFYWNFQFGIVI